MRQYVDAYTVANTIRMSASQHDGAFIIVEGSSDSRVYGRFLDERCQIVPALGKANATGALRMLDQESQPGVLAIIDSDFWRLDGTEPDSPNLFITDTHDLETMILSSPAFEKVLVEFCSARYRDEGPDDIRAVLLKIGMPLGFFRWLSSSKKENLGMKFKNLDFSAFVRIEGEEITAQVSLMVKEVRLNTHVRIEGERALVKQIEQLVESGGHDPWQVCRGHDLVAILVYLLRERYGSRRVRSLSEQTIDAILRLSYEHRFFRKTRLWEGLKGWEDAHEEYAILVGE